MGLLDYYRQFEGLSEEEVNAELRRQAAERKQRALARIEPLDLSTTTWPQLPHPNIVAAVTYAARRGLNHYADPAATALRAALAERHLIEPDRIVVGNGAAQLLGSLAAALLGPGEEVVSPWPSYPLYPELARRTGARFVPVPQFDAEAILAAVNADSRLVIVCNPNDPTGARMRIADVDRLAAALPQRVWMVLDEALVDSVEAEAPEASLPLLERHPRLVILRTFSKLWGLAGMRVGYALAGPSRAELLDRLAPELGVGELPQAGALEALRTCAGQLDEHRATVIAERRRILRGLEMAQVDHSPSQANFVWIAGRGLAERLHEARIVVQRGDAWGASDHIRVAVQDPPATDRLLRALE